MLIRRAKERGQSEMDWLKSYHSFSFAEYHDPRFMSFGPLRVINEDIIQPNAGFPMHAHHDMEIITYVISGVLAHKDNMGNGSLIKPGEIQRMSAGSGVKHSEFNASNKEPLHLFQIWILPEEKNLPPSYEQKQILSSSNQWVRIGGPESDTHEVKIHQAVDLFVTHLDTQRSLPGALNRDYGWLQVISGEILCNQITLIAGDAIGFSKETKIEMEAVQASHLLLFDMA